LAACGFSREIRGGAKAFRAAEFGGALFVVALIF
jgi:hypothetical protein